jgi:hypothetical protein
MKTIIILGFLLTAIAPIAHSETDPVKVIASVKAEVGQGLEQVKLLELPKNSVLSPKPSALSKEIEVKVIRFSNKKLSTDEFLKKLDEKIGLDEILAQLDKAGFRPAKIEEVAAVRDKLLAVLKDECVMICGTKAVVNGKDHYFACDFEYIPGTDFLTYPPGQFGLVTADWKTSVFGIVLAAVKKE